jgi:hypothetical protein
MYPLFVAAGWGLYELALTQRHRLVAGLILAGWLVAAPIIFLTMADPHLGRGDHWETRSLLTGKNASQIGYGNKLGDLAPVADYLDIAMSDKNHTVVMDSFEGWPIAVQVRPEIFRTHVIITPDRRFSAALENPRRYDVSHFLLPSPEAVPQDALVKTYPKLWAGKEPGFVLVKSFPNTELQWRLYRVVSPGTNESAVTQEEKNAFR